MKKFLFIPLCLFFIFISSKLSATHLVGIDGYIECLADTAPNGQQHFKIYIEHYVDEVASSVPADWQIDVAIYNNGVNKTLARTLSIQRISTQTIIEDANTSVKVQVTVYEGELYLPQSAAGYLLFYSRCCPAYSQNLKDDYGMSLLMEIPGNVPIGYMTPWRNFPIVHLVEKNTGNTFNYPWLIEPQDSIKKAIGRYKYFGTIQDPQPTFPSKFPSLNPGLYKSHASETNPLGTGGTYTNLNDSQFQVSFNQSGWHFLPYNTVIYHQGDSVAFDRLMAFFVLDTLIPTLILNLEDYSQSLAEFRYSSDYWKKPVMLTLQMSTDTGFASVNDVRANLSAGTGLSLHHASAFSSNTVYYYRIKAVSNNTTYYSNVVSFSPSGPGSTSVIKEVNWTIYPNPAQNQIWLNADTEGSYYLYTMNGQLIQSGELQIGENMIRFGDLKDGIYFLRSNGKSAKVVVRNE